MWCMLMAAADRGKEKVSDAMGGDDRAQADLQGILAGVLGIVGTILTAIVSIQVLGDLSPDFMDSLADFVGVYTSNSTTTNSSTADQLLPTLGLVGAIVGPLALLGLGIASMRLRK